MNTPKGLKRLGWYGVIVLIPLIGIVLQSRFGNELFERSGTFLILLALILFSAEKFKAEEKAKNQAKDKDRLKYHEEEAYRWWVVEVCAVALGTIILGFGELLPIP